MMNLRKYAISVFISGAWIGMSEFVRNELLLKGYWIEKYRTLGLEFPSAPVNNLLWGVWSFLMAGVIVHLVTRLRFLETILLTWVCSFVMMWVVIGNMNVLPPALLLFAVPWSFAEVALAAWLAKKTLGKGV